MTEHNGNGAINNLQFDEGMCERYLFGELTEAEQETFEAAYFDDDVFFDRFVAVKTELLDLYSRGELEPDKRARMEPHFLATAPRRKGLAEAREFIRTVNSISARDRGPKAAMVIFPEPSFFDSLARLFTLPRLAGAAVLLAAVTGGIFLINRSGQDGMREEQAVQQPRDSDRQNEISPALNSDDSKNRTSEPEVAANPAESNTVTPRRSTSPKSDVARRPRTKRLTPLLHKDFRRDQDRNDVAANPPDQNDKTIITIPDPSRSLEPSVTLRAGATRYIGGGNTLTIPAGAASASVKLIFRSKRYSSYLVTITNVAGSEKFQRVRFGNRSVPRMSDGSRQLTIRLNDTSGMGDKDYIVKLEGHGPGAAPETIEEYYFHVRRVTKSSTDGQPRAEPTRKP